MERDESAEGAFPRLRGRAGGPRTHQHRTPPARRGWKGRWSQPSPGTGTQRPPWPSSSASPASRSRPSTRTSRARKSASSPPSTGSSTRSPSGSASPTAPRPGVEESLAAAIAKFAEFVVEESPEASIVVARLAQPRRRRGAPHRARRRILRADAAREPRTGIRPNARPSDLAVRAIVGAIRTVVYRCLRDGHPEELNEHLGPLLELALAYLSLGDEPRPVAARPVRWHRAGRPTSRDRLGGAARQPAQPGHPLPARADPARGGAGGGARRLLGPDDPGDLGRRRHLQPDLLRAFRAQGAGLLAAFESSAGPCPRATFAAAVTETERAGRRSSKPGCGDCSNTSPPNRSSPGSPSSSCRPPARWRSTTPTWPSRSFTGFLTPQALPEHLEPLPQMLSEAIGGAVWAAIQHEIVAGNTSALPEWRRRSATSCCCR